MPKTQITKQVAFGVVQTNNTAGLGNTSYAEPTNQIRVTITPERTGKFQVYGNIAFASPANTGTLEARINKISGTGETLHQTNNAVLSSPSAASMRNTFTLENVYTLIAGTTYIFGVEARIPSGAGTYSAVPGDVAGGQAIMAKEI